MILEFIAEKNTQFLVFFIIILFRFKLYIIFGYQIFILIIVIFADSLKDNLYIGRLYLFKVFKY